VHRQHVLALLSVYMMATTVLIMGRVGRVPGLCALLMELMLSHRTCDPAHAHTAMFVVFARLDMC